MTREQVATALSVTVRTVDRYIKDGALPATRLPGGRLIRIQRQALDAMLEAS